MTTKVELVIIDPQNDFVDPGGALSVPKANKDMDRLALMIKRLGKRVSRISVTLDSHHKLHIATPDYWVDSNGNHPAGDTSVTISAQDVKDGKWLTTIPQLQERAQKYLEALETNKRYEHRIWPEHCLIGSNGAAVWDTLFNALLEWEQRPNVVNYVTKGSNLHTEHFSAVKAEVEDPEDPSTQLNTGFIKSLENADVVAFAGEASTHCLASTVRDIADAFGNDDYIKKCVLLKDATSPIPGLEFLEDQFIKDMTAKGMTISTTSEFLK